MSLIIGLFHSLRRNVCIDLSRGERLMAKQFLDASQIRSAVEQMRGEAVSKRMGTDRWIEAGHRQIFVQLASDASRAEPLSMLVDEDRLLVEAGSTGVRPSHVRVAPDPDECGRRDGCDPFFLALPANVE